MFYFHILHLLLTLREEDTTSSMYPRPEASPLQTQPVSGQKKVDVVCDALRSSMESVDPNKLVTLIFIHQYTVYTVESRSSGNQ